MHDELPAEPNVLVGARGVGDNAIKTTWLRLMKAAGLEPRLEAALRLLIPCGAHR